MCIRDRFALSAFLVTLVHCIQEVINTVIISNINELFFNKQPLLAHVTFNVDKFFVNSVPMTNVVSLLLKQQTSRGGVSICV